MFALRFNSIQRNLYVKNKRTKGKTIALSRGVADLVRRVLRGTKEAALGGIISKERFLPLVPSAELENNSSRRSENQWQKIHEYQKVNHRNFVATRLDGIEQNTVPKANTEVILTGQIMITELSGYKNSCSRSFYFSSTKRAAISPGTFSTATVILLPEFLFFISTLPSLRFLRPMVT